MEIDGFPHESEPEFEWHPSQPDWYSRPGESDIDSNLVDGRVSPEAYSEVADADAEIQEAAEALGLDEEELEIYKLAHTFAGRVRDTLESDAVQVVEFYGPYVTMDSDPEEIPEETQTRQISRFAFLEETLVEEAGDPEVEREKYILEARVYWPLPWLENYTPSDEGSKKTLTDLTMGGVSVTFHGTPSIPHYMTLHTTLTYMGHGSEALPVVHFRPQVGVTEPTDEPQGTVHFDSMGVEPLPPGRATDKLLPQELRNTTDLGQFITNMPGWVTGDNPSMITTYDSTAAQSLPETLQRVDDKTQEHNLGHRVLNPRVSEGRSLMQKSAPAFTDMLAVWAKHFPSQLIWTRRRKNA